MFIIIFGTHLFHKYILSNISLLSSSGTMETTREGNMTRPVLRQLLSNMLCYGLTFVDNTPANLEGTMAATGIISFPQVHLLPGSSMYVYW